MRRYDSALVLGLGASGDAAARLLLAEGAHVTVVDRGESDDLHRRAEDLASMGAVVRLGRSELPSENASVCIVSPGIPSDSPWVKTASIKGIPIVPELEIGWSRLKCRVMAITGSNGKSTLAKLCAESLHRAGMTTDIGGNYEASEGRREYPGICERSGLRASPVSLIALASRKLDWLVLEVSSFQLETVSEFRPDVAVLLNVFPNHLDRHKNMKNYRQVKCRLFARMTRDDTGIVPEDMAIEVGRPVSCDQPRWISFGVSDKADFRYRNGGIACAGDRFVSMAGTMFDNGVLGLTAAAAVAATDSCDCPHDCVEQAAREFVPLPHRMEEIGALGRVRFVDDSKCTNIEALTAALRMASGPVRLIAGGRPKGDDYAAARPILSGKVAGAYLIGEAAEAMFEAWHESIQCFISGTIGQAAQDAFSDARPGETVLLSPGCASFDQFSGYEERGKRFQQAVALILKKDQERT